MCAGADFNRQKLLALEQIPPENVSVKPNFVDPSETIVPYAARENQVVYIGRLDALKGIRLLLEAWARYERSAKHNRSEKLLCARKTRRQILSSP